MRAAEEGHLEAVKLLVAREADRELRNVQGQTASMRAALFRRDEIVRVLNGGKGN